MVSSKRGLLYPLDFVYRRSGLEPPACKRIAEHAVPQPYQPLLVHGNGMTSTLEQCFGAIVVRSLFTHTTGRSYVRRVLLVQESSARPVAMAAIRLNVGVFNHRVRAQILTSSIPLGRILEQNGLSYQSRPKAFFEFTPNSDMLGVFWMREPCLLYGRQTAIFIAGKKTGDVVEVLATIQPAATDIRPASARATEPSTARRALPPSSRPGVVVRRSR